MTAVPHLKSELDITHPPPHPHPHPPQKPKKKQVNEFDQKKAAAALGSDSRPLTRANVEKFLSDFGLEAEFSCHSNIRGLSGALPCGRGGVSFWLRFFRGLRLWRRLMRAKIPSCLSSPSRILRTCFIHPGGQKVKLVLAAAMWNSPHLLIMDEPTNYLDRWAAPHLLF